MENNKPNRQYIYTHKHLKTMPTDTVITVTESLTNHCMHILTLDTMHAVLSESEWPLAKTLSTGMKIKMKNLSFD